MNNPLEKAARLGLIALATARLTRFITSDMLGEWTIVGPLKRWAARREVPADLRADLEARLEDERENDEPTANPPQKWGWRSKMVKGLDCPFCVGFWIGVLVLAGEVATRTRPLRWARPLWTFMLGAFGLNYIIGHVSSRID